jgi:hypothetical protein
LHIAILAWGSLVWDPHGLPYVKPWKQGGPVLPIEFSRVSSDKRLTLVIDEENGSWVPTRYSASEKILLRDATSDLQIREGAKSADKTGYVDLTYQTVPPSRSRVPAAREVIQRWAAGQGFEAVIWTDLAPNFLEKKGESFSVESALKHLSELPPEARAKAAEYVRRAPAEIKTRFRQSFKELFGPGS